MNNAGLPYERQLRGWLFHWFILDQRRTSTTPFDAANVIGYPGRTLFLCGFLLHRTACPTPLPFKFYWTLYTLVRTVGVTCTPASGVVWRCSQVFGDRWNSRHFPAILLEFFTAPPG